MKKSPLNLLWIEDSDDDIELFSLAFARANVAFKLDVRRDGQDGLDHLMSVRHTASGRPDLIMLDLNLPRRDGREVLAQIKSNEQLRIIPVVVLTTSSTDSDILNAYALGASSYLVKPDGMPKLIKLVKGLSGFWEHVDLAPQAPA